MQGPVQMLHHRKPLASCCSQAKRCGEELQQNIAQWCHTVSLPVASAIEVCRKALAFGGLGGADILSSFPIFVLRELGRLLHSLSTPGSLLWPHSQHRNAHISPDLGCVSEFSQIQSIALLVIVLFPIDLNAIRLMRYYFQPCHQVNVIIWKHSITV